MILTALTCVILTEMQLYLRSGNSSGCRNRNNLFGGLWLGLGLGFVLGLGFGLLLGLRLVI